MAAPTQLNPSLVSSGIGALGSIATGFLNQAFNADSMDKQVAYAKELMDYEWQKYKSPFAQVQALAKAGLNPAVALGQGGSGFSATPNPSMPSSTPPQIGGISDIGSFVQALASAKKAGLEAVGQDLENQYLKESLNSRIEQIAIENNWKKEDTARIMQSVGLMSAQFQQIQQDIEESKSRQKFTDKQVQWFDRHMQAEINHLQNSAEYQKAMADLTSEQKELLNSTMGDLKNITHYNAQQLNKMVELLDKYGDAQAIVGMLSQLVDSASNLIT